MGNIVGITAEYDPFHNGHRYHLQKAREGAQAQTAICVMSGNFTQRGEPAICDKWQRGRIALSQGVNLVLELPFLYACSRAEHFASAAVRLLARSGATHIAFGCEAEHPQALYTLAERILAQEADIERLRRELMHSGHSYAKAGELAHRTLLGEASAQLGLQPNNILAIEYLKEILRLQADGIVLQPVPIFRQGSGYRQAAPEKGFAGGAALREKIAAGEDIRRFLPYVPEDGQDGLPWVDLGSARKRLYLILRGLLFRTEAADLRAIYGMGEGLEHRMLTEAVHCESYEAFLQGMTSRRYPASAIRRLILYILTGRQAQTDAPVYGRLLAADAAGRGVLRQVKQREDNLVILSGRDREDALPASIRESMKLDIRASNLYHLICGTPVEHGHDRKQHPYITG